MVHENMIHHGQANREPIARCDCDTTVGHCNYESYSLPPHQAKITKLVFEGFDERIMTIHLLNNKLIHIKQ